MHPVPDGPPLAWGGPEGAVRWEPRRKVCSPQRGCMYLNRLEPLWKKPGGSGRVRAATDSFPHSLSRGTRLHSHSRGPPIATAWGEVMAPGAVDSPKES